MENIKIIDNFLNNDDLQLLNNIISSKCWDFGQESTRDCTPFWIINLDDEIFFSKYIKDKIEYEFEKKFILKRVYANGQTFGQDGSYHVDDYEENTFTFCLYVHIIDNIEEDLGGNLYIKVPNEKIVFSIEPFRNRGVLFPSTYIHKGCAFNRYVKSMRVCIAWKLEEIIYNVEDFNPHSG
jgi:hypothetical protein